MRGVVVLAAAAALSAIPAAGGAANINYAAAVALDVLPPGQSSDLLFPPTAKDQLRLYAARWTNRPTFQQLITFNGHRPR